MSFICKGAGLLFVRCVNLILVISVILCCSACDAGDKPETYQTENAVDFQYGDTYGEHFHKHFDDIFVRYRLSSSELNQIENILNQSTETVPAEEIISVIDSDPESDSDPEPDPEPEPPAPIVKSPNIIWSLA